MNKDGECIKEIIVTSRTGKSCPRASNKGIKTKRMKPIWADGLVTCYNTRKNIVNMSTTPLTVTLVGILVSMMGCVIMAGNNRGVWRTREIMAGNNKKTATDVLWSYKNSGKYQGRRTQCFYHKMTRFLTLSLSMNGATGNPSSFSTSL